VKVMIWPAKLGSVTVSWSPDMPVVKTISPTATSSAPHASPSKRVPSSR
jgi:hypothetical protein